MPNGRAFALRMSEDDLRQFFDSIHGNPVVGRIEGVDVTLSHVKGLFVPDSEEGLFVEGQHEEGGTELVIHFPGDWLSVTEDRPMFKGLLKLCLESFRLGQE